MSSRRAAVVALVAIALAACTAAPGAGPVEPTTSGTSPTAATQPVETATPSAAPGTTPAPEATPTSTPEPTPKPTPEPTPVPVPPKPTGISFSYCCGLGGDGRSGVSWTKPRTKGIEIRVYGVTRCFPADGGADESCIRPNTALPGAIRILLASAPASKGGVTWVQGETDTGDCAYEFVSQDGTTFYSVVLAAYGASGHSKFAIADPGWYNIEEDSGCTPID
jgi:hypothetical protein